MGETHNTASASFLMSWQRRVAIHPVSILVLHAPLVWENCSWQGWKQMGTCLRFAYMLARSFPEFPFGKSSSFNLHESDCVFPFPRTLLIYILPYWLTSSWRVKNHSSNSRMTKSPFWLFVRPCFFMTTVSNSMLFHPTTDLKNGAPPGVVPTALVSLHVGEVKAHLWHKIWYGLLVPKMF